MITLSGTAIAALSAVAFGGWSLAAYFFRLVYTGRLVPAHDRDEWRAESRIKDALIAELSQQNSTLLGSAIPTINAVLSALHRAAEEQT